jgi:hypothetical protein
MRLIILPLCFIALTGAIPAAQVPSGSSAIMPGYTMPAQSWKNLDEALASRSCRDRIEQVREASGQPALDKSPAAPGQGYMINAVDMQIDGCAVMQMKGDVNDLRPLPPPNGPPRLQPAR